MVHYFSLFDIQIRCFQRFLYIYDIYNEINGKYTTKRIYFNHCTWDQIHVAGLFMGVYNMDTKNPIANSCPYIFSGKEKMGVYLLVRCLCSFSVSKSSTFREGVVSIHCHFKLVCLFLLKGHLLHRISYIPRGVGV